MRRKELEHSALVCAVCELLQNRFQPAIADIQKNIEMLIEKEVGTCGSIRVCTCMHGCMHVFM